MSEKYAQLVEYVSGNGRLCPLPRAWTALWEMLPDRRRLGGGWKPALPLILAAWSESPGLQKRLRLLEHIDWAEAHGCIDEVDAYLRVLSEHDWFRLGD